MSDDDIFDESDFEALENAIPPDDDPFWEVEETINVEEEEAAPRKVP